MELRTLRLVRKCAEPFATLRTRNAALHSLLHTEVDSRKPERVRLDEARSLLLSGTTVLRDPNVDAVDTYIEVGGNRFDARAAWLKVLSKLILLENAQHNHDHNAIIGHTTDMDGGW